MRQTADPGGPMDQQKPPGPVVLLVTPFLTPVLPEFCARGSLVKTSRGDPDGAVSLCWSFLDF